MMARSLAHTWGQVVGDLFESAFNELLVGAAANARVFIDFNGKDRARDCGVRNSRGKLAWRDGAENWHQLDFVYERDGTSERVGVPLAFVEVAWRRYTKHSKNKAQEIEGALIPIAARFRHAHPFLGAIVGGVFTSTSLQQMRSRGFLLIYVPYDNVLKAFAKVGIDANYDEKTKEKEYKAKLAQFAVLTERQKKRIQQAIVSSVADQANEFIANLAASIGRHVSRIVVVPLHGEVRELGAVDEAIAFVASYPEEAQARGRLLRYEIQVRFSNKAELRGEFPTKAEALAFLRGL